MAVSTTPVQAVKRFVSRTGMHAVPSIASENRRVSRVCWTILLLFAVGLLTRQIVGLAIKLLSYPTSTSTSVDYHRSMTFPSVTFCNLNPLRLSRLIALDSGSGRRQKRSTSVSMFLDAVGVKRRPEKPQVFGFSGPMEKPPTTPPPLLRSKSLGRKTREDFSLRQRALFMMNTWDKALLDDLTYDLNEILVDCSLTGESCQVEDFIQFMSPRLGACYIFNSGANFTDLLSIERSGTTNSLELTLFVDQGNYLPNVADVAGFKFVIHPSVNPPMPDEKGFVVPPGMLTSFGLKMTQFERQPAPYGRCKNFTEEDNRRLNMYAEVLPHTIPTLDVCMSTCLQLQTLTQCRCYSLKLGFPNAPSFSKFNRTIRNHPCNVDQYSDDHICFENILRNKMEFCQESMCPNLPCTSDRYEVSQSSADWPASTSAKKIYKLLKSRGPKDMPNNLTESYVKKNFAKVRIYFDDLNVIHFRTEPAYTAIDFLSDLGGQGGLWLGISMFTILELGVLIGDLTRIFICATNQQDPQRKEEDERNEEKEMMPLTAVDSAIQA